MFVEFYAPWCPHCKRFATPYYQMAKRFAESPSLKFVKIDGAENELSFADAPEVPEVRSYPTLLHFKRDQVTGERIRVPVKYPFALTPDNVEKVSGVSSGSVFGRPLQPTCSTQQHRSPMFPNLPHSSPTTLWQT